MDNTNYNIWLGQKIRRLRMNLNLSQEELAKRVGYMSPSSRTTINKIETGQRNVSSTMLARFANALGVDVMTFFAYGTEEDDPAPTNAVPIAPKAHLRIPLVGQIACGTPILAAENIEEMLPDLPGVHADMALRCRGDSMIGAGIYNGDIAYIRLQPIVDNGSIVAVRIGDEATLKRYTFDGTKMILKSENKAYPEMVYQGTALADVKILGKLVGVVRRF